MISLPTSVLGIGLLLGAQAGMAADEKPGHPRQAGKQLAIGYCQACHYFEGTDQAGTIAPPFVAMSARFPERDQLRKLLHDPHVTRPYSMMPPFGRNGLLTPAQIEQIIDFLYDL